MRLTSPSLVVGGEPVGRALLGFSSCPAARDVGLQRFQSHKWKYALTRRIESIGPAVPLRFVAYVPAHLTTVPQSQSTWPSPVFLKRCRNCLHGYTSVDASLISYFCFFEGHTRYSTRRAKSNLSGRRQAAEIVRPVERLLPSVLLSPPLDTALSVLCLRPRP